MLTLCHVAQLAQVPLLESIWCWLYAKNRHHGGSQTRGHPYYTSGYNLSTFVFVFVFLSEFVFAHLKVVFVFAPLGEQWADTKVVLRPLLHIRIWDVRVKTKINFFLRHIPSIWLCQIKLSSQTHFLSNVMSLKSQSVEKVSIVFFGRLRNASSQYIHVSPGETSDNFDRIRLEFVRFKKVVFVVRVGRSDSDFWALLAKKYPTLWLDWQLSSPFYTSQPSPAPSRAAVFTVLCKT